MFTPDPLSVLWEPAAERILIRAYMARGEWFGTRITDPAPRHRDFARRLRIRIDGPDTATARKARTRWARAFVRALERANKLAGSRPIVWEVGRHIPASPTGARPAGRALRVRVLEPGDKAMRAVRRKPEAERIYDDEGQPAGRFAHPELRDWGQG